MMTVYFQNCKGEDRKIGSAADHGEVWAIIYAFLKEHNYKPNYIRMWEEEKKHWYDVGSHNEFFYAEEEIK